MEQKSSNGAQVVRKRREPPKLLRLAAASGVVHLAFELVLDRVLVHAFPLTALGMAARAW